VADAELGSIDELLTIYGLADAPIVAHALRPAERILRFFGSPVVQSILMLMMLGGLYFELQTPGVGFPGLMAAIGATMFFGPLYLLGLVENWEIALFVVGVGLLLAEIFVIPGFGIAGVAGLIAVVFSLGVSLIGNIGFDFPSGAAVSSAVMTLAVTFVLFIILLFSLGRYLPRSERFNQLVLQPALSSDIGYTSADSHLEFMGKNGLSTTPLRPSGSAEIGGRRVDVVTDGEFIDSGTPVEVVNVQGARVQVRAVKRLAEPESDQA
jgi:membrane-bound serine protease (ClpP class)